MRKRVRCAVCLFAQIDEKASKKGWAAYRCKNSGSEYYGALLNVSEDGCKEKRVTWQGCEWGRKKDDSVEVC